MMFLLTVVALALAVNQIFRLNFFKITTGNVLVSQQYMYLTLGTMVSMVFIRMNTIDTIVPRVRYIYCWETSTLPVVILKKLRRKI